MRRRHSTARPDWTLFPRRTPQHVSLHAYSSGSPRASEDRTAFGNLTQVEVRRSLSDVGCLTASTSLHGHTTHSNGFTAASRGCVESGDEVRTRFGGRGGSGGGGRAAANASGGGGGGGGAKCACSTEVPGRAARVPGTQSAPQDACANAPGVDRSLWPPRGECTQGQ